MIKEMPVVRVKPHSYQPSKAELEEAVVIRKADDSIPTPEELVRAALRPVKITEDIEA
ncbi:MAG: hypothetical protein GDA39_06830 [Hyphomonadaceae bacterium]|nr:hypothetical protein [Hyphomonadaceae bacterium]MBC6412601.1 hypothetical protein [Hyphomonadaceae bacterium]